MLASSRWTYMASDCSSSETPVSSAAKTFTSFSIEEILGLNRKETTAAATECRQLQSATRSSGAAAAAVASVDSKQFPVPLPWVTAVTPSPPLPMVCPPRFPLLKLLSPWPPKPHLLGGKGRKARTVFTADQVNLLEERFAANKYLSVPERIKIAQDLDLSEQQVKTWFQNRRTKWRRRLREQDQAEEDQDYMQASGEELAEGPSALQDLGGEIDSDSEED